MFVAHCLLAVRWYGLVGSHLERCECDLLAVCGNKLWKIHIFTRFIVWSYYMWPTDYVHIKIFKIRWILKKILDFLTKTVEVITFISIYLSYVSLSIYIRAPTGQGILEKLGNLIVIFPALEKFGNFDTTNEKIKIFGNSKHRTYFVTGIHLWFDVMHIIVCYLDFVYLVI